MKKAAETFEKLIAVLSAKTKLSKKLVLTVALLLSGAVFLLLSEVGSGGEKQVSEQVSVSVTQSAEGYAEMLENRLISIISSIDGAGATKVMVTLESSGEDIYLHNSDYGENVDSLGKNSLERKDEYVIVDSGDGENGIVIRKTQPEIRGVAVVCQGGGNEAVRAQIVSTVTALLDISSARVSVVKMSE